MVGNLMAFLVKASGASNGGFRPRDGGHATGVKACKTTFVSNHRTIKSTLILIF